MLRSESTFTHNTPIKLLAALCTLVSKSQAAASRTTRPIALLQVHQEHWFSMHLGLCRNYDIDLCCWLDHVSLVPWRSFATAAVSPAKAVSCRTHTAMLPVTAARCSVPASKQHLNMCIALVQLVQQVRLIVVSLGSRGQPQIMSMCLPQQHQGGTSCVPCTFPPAHVGRWTVGVVC